MEKNCPLIHGMTTVGTRGQIVIPQNIREAMNVKAGDEMVVMSHQDKIVVMPAKLLETYYASILGQLDTVRGTISKKPKKR